MTMMIDLNTQDLDFFDEDYFGPPPRFLVEDKASEPAPSDADTLYGYEERNSALHKLKSLFGIL